MRGGRALVLTGPSGAGKSTAARLLAAAAGFAVVEWAPPVPTSWHEHRHASAQGGGGEYTSKMDAFEAWLARARTLAPRLRAFSGSATGGRMCGARKGRARCAVSHAVPESYAVAQLYVPQRRSALREPRAQLQPDLRLCAAHTLAAAALCACALAVTVR